MRRLILAFAILLLAGCTSLEEGRFALGTYVRIKAWGQGDLQEAFEAAFAEIDRVEGLTSVFDPESGVWALNHEAEIVSAELAGLIGEALEVSVKSEGAFDPTVFPLLELWGFYDSTQYDPKLPSKEEIEEVLMFVDYRMIEIEADTIRLDLKRAKGVDLSGIAKGYAVDRAVKVLRERGVTRGLVDAGGDIFCFGERNGGWRIGIRNPRSENPNDLLGIIKIDSGAVATSGDYENFFELDGVRYHHLIDPATGIPAREAISATVIAPTATQADAWATALFVMGEKGIAILDSLDDLEGMIVLKDGEVIKTSRFPTLEGP
ncbi:FAD:protein FMN transferase [candidate division WOR-3 bacterium]|nr:FAD:protein FMN transferase [candidate division WOR-3 bacterium]